MGVPLTRTFSAVSLEILLELPSLAHHRGSAVDRNLSSHSYSFPLTARGNSRSHSLIWKELQSLGAYVPEEQWLTVIALCRKDELGCKLLACSRVCLSVMRALQSGQEWAFYHKHSGHAAYVLKVTCFNFQPKILYVWIAVSQVAKKLFRGDENLPCGRGSSLMFNAKAKPVLREVSSLNQAVNVNAAELRQSWSPKNWCCLWSTWIL